VAKYKRNKNIDRKYQLSRGETPKEMVVRLFKRGRSINFIAKKVPDMTGKQEEIIKIVSSHPHTRRLWKQEELKKIIKEKRSQLTDIQRINGEFRERILRERDEHIANHKKKLTDHFDKRLETAIKRRMREHDYRIKKNVTVEGCYKDLHFRKTVEHDFLKFTILAFPFIKEVYELSDFQFEVLLLLHSEGVFYRKDIPKREGESSIYNAFFKEKKLINVWRTDREGVKLYTVSDKGTSIVNETYKYMTGKSKVPTSKIRKSKTTDSLAAFLKKTNSLTS